MLAYGELAGILLAGYMRKLADWSTTGISIEESRDLIAELVELRNREPVYVFSGGIPAWAFYTTDWNVPDTRRLARLGASAFRTASYTSTDSIRSLSPCDAGRREVIGLATGSTWDEARGWAAGGPPEAWGEAEAQRLRMAAGPYVWIFAAHYQKVVLEGLLEQIGREGGVVGYRRTATGAAIYRVQFRPSGTMASSWNCAN